MLDSTERYSLRDLRLMAGNNTALQISIERLFAQSFDEQQQLIERALDWCGVQMVSNRHLKLEHSEDELTIDIVQMLCAMGYDATHDTQVGGHADIVVQGIRDFRWIGEAKVHKDYDWLIKGLNQLMSRYLTGNPGQNTGELIIFVRSARMDKMVDKWIEILKRNFPESAVASSPYDYLVHYSTHIHPASGRECRVRHKPIHLFWDPDDRERLSSASR